MRQRQENGQARRILPDWAMRLLAAAGLTIVLGFSPATIGRFSSGEPRAGTSVWTVDLVQTLPDRQAEYLSNIETNWANARRIATDRKAVLSYRALVASPDTLREWDILLMTEYADSSAWSQRETIFEAIFASPEFVRVPMVRPSVELRKFAASGVVMRALVLETSR